MAEWPCCHDPLRFSPCRSDSYLPHSIRSSTPPLPPPRRPRSSLCGGGSFNVMGDPVPKLLYLCKSYPGKNPKCVVLPLPPGAQVTLLVQELPGKNPKCVALCCLCRRGTGPPGAQVTLLVSGIRGLSVLLPWSPGTGPPGCPSYFTCAVILREVTCSCYRGTCAVLGFGVTCWESF